MINDCTRWAWRSDESRRRLRALVLSVLLLDDERADVVAGLLVVFGVAAVAVGELQRDRRRSEGNVSLGLIQTLTPLFMKTPHEDISSAGVTVTLN